MTPYGIVYSDNVLSLNESKKLWLKKEKIINKGIFLLGYIFIVILLAVSNICILSFSKEPDTAYIIYLFVLESVLSFLLLYITVKKNKETAYAQVCFENNEKKQIVLKEQSMVITSAYRQSEYFYDEIEQVIETGNTITLFFDSKHAYPIYVSKNSVEIGNISIFRNILNEKMGNRYMSMGGGV